MLGMYVDISMFIRIGESAWNAITATESTNRNYYHDCCDYIVAEEEKGTEQTGKCKGKACIVNGKSEIINIGKNVYTVKILFTLKRDMIR